jgi:hypothetical protein
MKSFFVSAARASSRFAPTDVVARTICLTRSRSIHAVGFLRPHRIVASARAKTRPSMSLGLFMPSEIAGAVPCTPSRNHAQTPATGRRWLQKLPRRWRGDLAETAIGNVQHAGEPLRARPTTGRVGTTGPTVVRRSTFGALRSCVLCLLRSTFDVLRSSPVFPLYACPQSAQQFPRDRPDRGSDFADVEAFLALAAEQDDLVAG